MTSVGLQCRTTTEASRPGRTASAPAPARSTCEARLNSENLHAGVVVSFSCPAAASALQLAHSAMSLGQQGVQLVSDAAQATADVAGEVLEHGVLAGVVGAAVVGTLL
ncbi:hypothetical protein [Roseateles puraquae]|jgi:hypothetical protein|uniref:hypothetical protein n=1 Tax=Roseateles puraquae TaxID=431059 RepID=UPI0031D242FB